MESKAQRLDGWLFVKSHSAALSNWTLILQPSYYFGAGPVCRRLRLRRNYDAGFCAIPIFFFFRVFVLGGQFWYNLFPRLGLAFDVWSERMSTIFLNCGKLNLINDVKKKKGYLGARRFEWQSPVENFGNLMKILVFKVFFGKTSNIVSIFLK